MTDHLLDSNVLIHHLRQKAAVTALLHQWAATGDLCISVVTRAEILAGMRPHEERVTMALLDSLVSLPITIPIADQAGQWIYQYARQGIQLSFPDALIAATAVLHDLTLVTTDARHFPMDDLEVRLLRADGFGP